MVQATQDVKSGAEATLQPNGGRQGTMAMAGDEVACQPSLVTQSAGTLTVAQTLMAAESTCCEEGSQPTPCGHI